MGIQVILTDDDATRYFKWLANMRQPKQSEESSQQSTTSKTTASAPPQLSTRREQLKDIRSWAAQHGFNIAARGRIPQPVMEAYDRAHSR